MGFRIRPFWMVHYVCVLHLIWGAMLLLWPSVVHNITPLYSLVRFFKVEWLVGIFLILSGLITFLSLVDVNASNISKLLKFKFAWFLLLIPQQILFMITAGGAIERVILHAYADGVPRPWQFILADQFPAILTAVIHTFGIIDHHFWRIKNGMV